MTTTDLVIRIIQLEGRINIPTSHIQDVLIRASRILAGLEPAQSFDTVGQLLRVGQEENVRLGNPITTYVPYEPIPLGQTQEELTLEQTKNGN